MFDLRDYKSVIREAVKLESDRDPNWNWKVKAINKTEIKIGWGYLDYLCDGRRNEYFSVKLIEMYFDDEGNLLKKEVGESELSLAGFYPDDPTMRDSLYVWIGDKHWHDAKSLEDGLKLIVHAIANRAHNTY